MQNIQILKNFIYFIGRRAFFWAIVSFLSSTCLAICELLVAVFLQFFLVSLNLIELKSPLTLFSFKLPQTSLNTTLFILIFIGFFRALCQFLTTQSTVFSQESVACRLKTLSTFDMIYRKSSKSFSTSDINFRFSEVIPKTYQAMFYFLSSFSSSVQVGTLYLIMLLMAYKESLVAFLGLLFIGIVTKKINQSISHVSAKIPLEQAKINSIIEKISHSYLFMKISKTEKQEENTTYNHIINYSQHALRSNTLSFLNLALTPFLGILFLICIIFISQIFFHTNSLVLISFIYLLVRFVQAATNLSNYYSLFTSFKPNLMIALDFFYSFQKKERSEILDIPSKLNIFGSSKNKNYFLNATSHEIIEANELKPPLVELKHVSFKYPFQEKNIIHDLSFTIEQNEHVGIIGASGSGKSTLIMLLIGILKPQQGTLLYDQRDIENYNVQNHLRIGYVGAEPFLMEGSIKENLTYGIKHTVTEKELHFALKFAQIEDFVSTVGLGYKINEDMSGLSSGQKQKICIARAILNKPQLLILDEASANLDEKTEEEISNSIQQLKNCSVIIISHRPGFLKNIKKIISLNSGAQR